jgi:hypothetical protein
MDRGESILPIAAAAHRHFESKARGMIPLTACAHGSDVGLAGEDVGQGGAGDAATVARDGPGVPSFLASGQGGRRQGRQRCGQGILREAP